MVAGAGVGVGVGRGGGPGEHAATRERQTMMTMLYLLALLGIFAAVGWFGWQYFGGGSAALFGGNREARIGVSEIASIDGKRKLLLIHRDGVEHLVMTGGPIDVVIEQGIQPQRRPAAALAPAPIANYEPRLATQPAGQSPSDAGPELPPGFGRLRQRGAPAIQPESSQRADGPNYATGGGNR